MKYILTSLIILLSAEVCGQYKGDDPFKKLSGFSHPESVIFDEKMKVYYVSNMADRENKDGFISKISANKKILDTVWIKGLNDPKGLLVHNDRLFVTDVTFLVEINRKTGEILRRTPVENSKSLNDITADAQGNIYISDLSGNSIFKRDTSGNISQWLHAGGLDRPNGLLVSEGDLYVASWGSEDPGHFLKVDIKTKEIQQITHSGIGNLDGIQKISHGSFYISDWATGTIYKVKTNGSIEEVVKTAKSSGDILFLKDSAELVIPMNHQNEIWWYHTN